MHGARSGASRGRAPLLVPIAATGDPLPYHCEGWTSTMPSFTPRGLATAADSAWAMSGPDACTTKNHLYCFEQ
jgi:hypothetical protein